MYSPKLNILFLFFSVVLFSQERISLVQIIDLSIENNFQNTLNDVQIRKSEFEREGAAEIPKTGIFVENEEFRPSDANGVWKVGISQEIPWPGLNKARKAYMDRLVSVHKMNREAIKAEIKRDVKRTYFELWYLQDKQNLYKQLGEIYKNMFDAATVRYNTGEVAGLDKIAAEVKYNEIQVQLQQIEKEVQLQQRELMLLTNRPIYFLPEEKPLTKLSDDDLNPENEHPLLLVQQQNIKASESLIKVQRNANRPDFSGRVFSQTLYGAKDPITGFSFTVAFPLFGLKSMKNKVKALEADVELQTAELKWTEMNLNNRKEQALIQLEKAELMLDFYEKSGLMQAESIISAATLSYRSGEISFAELSQYLAQAISIKQNYLDALNQYNQSMIEYRYFTNQN